MIIFEAIRTFGSSFINFSLSEINFSTTFQEEQLEQKTLISFATREIIVVKISCRLHLILFNESFEKQPKRAGTTFVLLSY